jgi:hypothetical protein
VNNSGSGLPEAYAVFFRNAFKEIIDFLILVLGSFQVLLCADFTLD